MFVPVRSSSPSMADLIRPSPRASTRHTRGRNSADLGCSSTSAFSSARSSGLLSASLLASMPQGDCEWYSSLASLGVALPPLPAGRVDSTGVASLVPTARGCELPLLEPLPQALFSAIFFCGSLSVVLSKVSLNSSEFECSLLSSYVEPTVPSA